MSYLKKSTQKNGKVAFWKQITEEWNRRHPEAKYSTWKGASIAYGRVVKNMGGRFQASASTENSIGVLLHDLYRIELNFISEKDNLLGKGGTK
jgi:hypothetical protein